MRIKELRRSAGLTQSELAEKIGSSRDTVSAWERGKAEPSARLLRRTAEALGASVGYLLGEDPPGTP